MTKEKPLESDPGKIRRTMPLPWAAPLLFFLLFFGAPGEPAAAERILFHDSTVEIQPDGSLVVTERITVQAEGEKIKRGIYRTFPTRYRTRLGTEKKVPFRVLKVLRNGESEPYHLRKVSNGQAVYIGRKDLLLQPGEYTYTLVYETEDQVGFFDEYDELYWNATGNEWDFVIEEARSEVRLPRGASATATAAYTGRQGERGEDWESIPAPEGKVVIAATGPLAPGEGLTVAVSWPKGIVPEPDRKEKALKFVTGNRGAAAALAGFAILLLYYAGAWLAVGKDPPAGVIVPLFAPPEGYSAAAVHFVTEMGFGKRAFAAALVNMAVKGSLSIEERDGVFTLHDRKSREHLSAGERKVAEALFPGGRESLELKKSSHGTVRKALAALQKSLEAEFGKRHFRINGKYLLPGAALSLLLLVVVAALGGINAPAIFLMVWLSFWTLACIALAGTVLGAWKAFVTGSKRRAPAFAAALFITLFASPFFAGEAFALYALAHESSPLVAGILVMIVAVNLFFSHLIKAPTLFGRKIMDRIEGFLMYLEAAEGDRLERMNPRERNPGLFEEYLPYAIALGVENSWGKKFADLLEKAGSGEGRGAYSPGWYSGGTPGAPTMSSLTSSLGSSFTSAISSSSTPPGSSSGSGGGGSSGGGGGGGGGGGW